MNIKHEWDSVTKWIILVCRKFDNQRTLPKSSYGFSLEKQRLSMTANQHFARNQNMLASISLVKIKRHQFDFQGKAKTNFESLLKS